MCDGRLSVCSAASLDPVEDTILSHHSYSIIIIFMSECGTHL